MKFNNAGDLIFSILRSPEWIDINKTGGVFRTVDATNYELIYQRNLIMLEM
jgi:hypothetical protein